MYGSLSKGLAQGIGATVTFMCLRGTDTTCQTTCCLWPICLSRGPQRALCYPMGGHGKVFSKGHQEWSDLRDWLTYGAWLAGIERFPCPKQSEGTGAFIKHLLCSGERVLTQQLLSAGRGARSLTSMWHVLLISGPHISLPISPRRPVKLKSFEPLSWVELLHKKAQ